MDQVQWFCHRTVHVVWGSISLYEKQLLSKFQMMKHFNIVFKNELRSKSLNFTQSVFSLWIPFMPWLELEIARFLRLWFRAWTTHSANNVSSCHREWVIYNKKGREINTSQRLMERHKIVIRSNSHSYLDFVDHNYCFWSVWSQRTWSATWVISMLKKAMITSYFIGFHIWMIILWHYQCWWFCTSLYTITIYCSVL
jgi:hypothetical protein